MNLPVQAHGASSASATTARRAALIVNPRAGGGRPSRTMEAVQHALTQLGVEHHVELTVSLDHARELARAAVRSGEIAVAFGGDGLIGAVAESVHEGDGVLGMLPGGRGNDFIRGLGIPTDPVDACRVLAGRHIRRLDLGRVGSRTFIGIASCGFDSVANRIANETTLVRGNLVYAYGALRALAGWRPAAFTVAIDGGIERTFTGYTVAAANARFYGGGMMLAPQAELEDGQLDVVLVSDAPKLRFLRLLPTVFSGSHVRQANVDVIRASSIDVAASRPFTLYADGDPIAELPVRIEILPKALQTIVPAIIAK